jgi:hypothetical protein
LGLLKTFGLTVGTWSLIIGVFIVLIVLFFNKKYILYGTIGNIIALGPMIDFFLNHNLISIGHSVFIHWMIFLIGTILFSLGGGIYVSAKFGAGPRDALVLLIGEKMGWNIVRVRFFLELTVFLIGSLLGGPVFFGTIIFSFIVSKVFKVSNEYSMRFVEKLENKKGIKAF